MHNAKPEHTFKLAVNHMADLTHEEYKRLLGFSKADKPALRNVQILDEDDVPASVDWVKEGAVNAVQNQGECGSCWAFSTVASIEGHYEIQHKKLVKLSEQQLVDCGSITGNNGCNGGLMDNGFKYAETYQLETESAYPYTALQGTCPSAIKEGGKIIVESYKDVATNSPAQLKAAVAQGPVSIAIEADQEVF